MQYKNRHHLRMFLPLNTHFRKCRNLQSLYLYSCNYLNTELFQPDTTMMMDMRGKDWAEDMWEQLDRVKVEDMLEALDRVRELDTRELDTIDSHISR